MFVYINARGDLFRELDARGSRLPAPKAKAIRGRPVPELVKRAKPLMADAQKLWALCRLPPEDLAKAAASALPTSMEDKGMMPAPVATRIAPLVQQAREEASAALEALEESEDE